MVQVVVVQFDHGGVFAAAVNDTRYFIRATQAAARSGALSFARFCFDCNFHVTLQFKSHSRPNGSFVQVIDLRRTAKNLYG